MSNQRVNGIGLTIGLIMAIWHPLYVRADEVGESSKHAVSKEAEFVMNATVNARKDLRGGSYRCIGYITISKNGTVNRRSASEMDCHFDLIKGLWRCETKEPFKIGVSNSTEFTPEVRKAINDRKFTPAPESSRLRDIVTIAARTPDALVEWHAIGNASDPGGSTSQVHIRKPTEQPLLFFLHPFSPSACGAMSWIQFQNGMSLDDVFRMNLDKVISVDIEAGSSDSLDLNFTYELFQRRMTVIPTLGYQITRMEQYPINKELQRYSQECDESESKWELKDSTWVPVHISVSTTTKEGLKRAYDYDLIWDHINPDRIDNSLFTYKSFQGVRKGQLVMDMRGPKPEHVDTVGAPFVKLQPYTEHVPSVPKTLTTKIILVMLNLVLGVILTYAYLLRKRRSE